MLNADDNNVKTSQQTSSQMATFTDRLRNRHTQIDRIADMPIRQAAVDGNCSEREEE